MWRKGKSKGSRILYIVHGEGGLFLGGGIFRISGEGRLDQLSLIECKGEGCQVNFTLAQTKAKSFEMRDSKRCTTKSKWPQ